MACFAAALTTSALAAQDSVRTQPVAGASREAMRRDSVRRSMRPPPRRIALTPSLERSAFLDDGSRELLQRARRAQNIQDDALRAYSARSDFQYSWWLRTRTTQPERLLARAQQVARVAWTRDSGLWVEPVGHRDLTDGGAVLTDFLSVTPIPHWSGRASLWIPTSGDIDAEINARDVFHPLVEGAEADYHYASGDSVMIGLADGRRIRLHELRVTPRRPTWHAVVGSFWFDAESGSLVRAAYRLSTDIDLWQFALEPHRDSLAAWDEQARATSTTLSMGTTKRPTWPWYENLAVGLMQGSVRPFRINLSVVTVEYGLHEGRFWLPREHSAEAEVVAGAMRVRIQWNERFRYDSVNGSEHVALVPAEPTVGEDTTAWIARAPILPAGVRRGRSDSMLAASDSLAPAHEQAARERRTQSALANARGDTARALRDMEAAFQHDLYVRQLQRRRTDCASSSTYVAGTMTREGGGLRAGVRMPCDRGSLASSPVLPASIYQSEAEVFGSDDRAALKESLSGSLQAGWAPQRPILLTGLSFLRYNRIEGLSLGSSAMSTLGQGYSAGMDARIGLADRVPNAQAHLSRSNGRAEWRASAFSRLAVANDDWGDPFSFGASASNLLFARDEGFFFRTAGIELSGHPVSGSNISGGAAQWRLFAEQHRTAGRPANTQRSLANALGSAAFTSNFDAERLSVFGASGAFARSFGGDPRRLRVDTRTRAEAAFTNSVQGTSSPGYARVMVDGTMARNLGLLTGALTGATGIAAGSLPLQRAFYVGGQQTVRGQFARAEGAGRVGDAFWLTRAELGVGSPQLRLSLFYDAGWAGARTDLNRQGRALSGRGVGLSFLEGVARLDFARGVWPEQRRRVDLSIGVRF